MRTLLGTLALALAVPLSVASTAASAQPGGPDRADASDPSDWTFSDRVVDDTQSFRGLDAVGRKTAWIAGEDITEDGGPGSVYRTTDGGKTWKKTFQNKTAKAFFNCIDFYDGGRTGLGVSDPVRGKFRIVRTKDHGRSWDVVRRKGMPAAVDGEFNFAASGTCLTIVEGEAYMASGGAASRIFHSDDTGRTWDVTDAPIPATPAGGVFSLSFKDAGLGVAVGGDFEAPDNGVDASGFTRNGTSWRAGGDLSGYRSGSDWVDGSMRTFVAVGPNGIDATTDAGRTWTSLGEVGYHAVACAPTVCFTSGSDGRAGHIVTE